MKKKFQRGLYHALLIFNVNRILDEHETVMKNFFKETTCIDWRRDSLYSFNIYNLMF